MSFAELRGLVAALLGRVHALEERVEPLRMENQALRADNQVLKDEIARLKGLPPRPTIKPSKPSGMEKASGALPGKGKRGGRSAKRDRVSREVVVKAAAPAGSRFKGYETILVRDLVLAAEVVRYRRERWVTPAGEAIVAPLPAGILGGWGPNLRRFILTCHIQGQVTTERLTALLTGIGVDISKEIDVKAAMLACHASQREWLLKHHGMDQYLQAMRDWGAHRGRAAGVGYAEGFRQHRGHSYPQDNLLGNLLGQI